MEPIVTLSLNSNIEKLNELVKVFQEILENLSMSTDVRKDGAGSCVSIKIAADPKFAKKLVALLLIRRAYNFKLILIVRFIVLSNFRAASSSLSRSFALILIIAPQLGHFASLSINLKVTLFLQLGHSISIF